jgi:hypothetical protein
MSFMRVWLYVNVPLIHPTLKKKKPQTIVCNLEIFLWVHLTLELALKPHPNLLSSKSYEMNRKQTQRGTSSYVGWMGSRRMHIKNLHKYAS